MSVKIQSRNLEIPPKLEQLIERKLNKIRKMLPTFSPEVLDIHVNIERLPRGHQFQTVLLVTTPQTSIRAEEIENEAASSFLRAFEELLRRIKRFKSQLNRESFWQRDPMRSRAVQAGENRRDLENVINQNLDKIENYVRRELYHQALIRDFPPGIAQAQALVDDVFLEVCSDTNARPESVPLEKWMFQIARRKISERVEAIDRSREERSLEEPENRIPRWEDEDSNFYQPDEVIRLEDIVRDEHSFTPEELLEREETEEQLQRAVARLPGPIRESFVLFALEGFNSDEVAMITGKRPDRVREEVEKARRMLRQGNLT